MTKPIKHRRAFALLALLFSLAGVLLVLEVGSAVILQVKFHRGAEERQLAVQRVLDELPQQRRDGAAAQGSDRRLNLGREVHPFFGFTTTRNFPGVNNLGFYSHDSYPYHRDRDELVVGVFGGSVAQQLASDAGVREDWQKSLLPLATARGRARVKILSMALPGWRQPQQFLALHYFLDSIDVAVTLDGINEVTGIATNLDRNYPVDYPNPEVWLPLTKGTTRAEDVRAAAEILSRQDGLRDLTEVLTGSLLGKSALAHLVWQVSTSRQLKRIDGLRQAMASSQWQDYDTTPGDEEGAQALTDGYFGLYERSIRTASSEAKAQGKLSFHFIQPNQYDPGSKPLSEVENREFLANHYYATVVPRYYPRLRKMVSQLRDDGIAAFDMTSAFAASKDTLYRDDCCHLNEQGNLILARSMAVFMLATGAKVSH